MKKLLLSLSLLAAVLGFNACSTDVDLYADYKDIPIIYGLLDASLDTNYIRINRAFSGSSDNHIDATEVALIEDSCNYPGKLRAYIVKYRNAYGNTYVPTDDIIELDTITINNKEEGIFYSPRQKVYFTDQPLAVNNGSSKFKYKLFVHKDNDTITAETGIVGGEDFKVITQSLGFAVEESNRTGRILFTQADNAVFYDTKMVFYYWESHNGGPFEQKALTYKFGAKSIDELNKDGNMFYVTYSENALFNMLRDAIGSDTVVNPNHPHVIRYFDKKPMTITIAAGGDELYNYIQVNQQTGFSQTVPDYTNIFGGRGVFSSRVNLVKNVVISARTQSDLYGIEAWGFQQQ